MLDLLIQNGTLVMPDGLQVGDLAIHDGRIAAVGMPGALPTARRAWDAAGCFVLPGGIDPHVHIHWPFLAATTADDYAIASRAAALGGTTTVIDFAHPKMGPTPLDRVAYRQSEADGRSIIDYGLHCVLTEGTPEILDQMARLVSQGVTSFKMYMAYSRRGIMVSDATLLSVMQQAARLGALACIHGENGTVADAIEARFLAEGRTAATDFPQHKPNFVEAEAIERAIFWGAAGGRPAVRIPPVNGRRAGADPCRPAPGCAGGSGNLSPVLVAGRCGVHDARRGASLHLQPADPLAARQRGVMGRDR